MPFFSSGVSIPSFLMPISAVVVTASLGQLLSQLIADTQPMWMLEVSGARLTIQASVVISRVGLGHVCWALGEFLLFNTKAPAVEARR